MTTLLKADAENGFWSITGLAIDVDNNRLWLSSAATPSFAGYSAADQGHGAVFELDLKTLEVLNRYNMPVDGLRHEPGSLVVTDDHHVYVIDRALPVVYQKTPEGTHLEAFMANPGLLGLTGIAITPDNSRIFVSDSAMGIMVIDPIAVQAAMLSGPETLNLGGIGSVSYSEGNLFVIQNGFVPQRIMRLTLDGTGAAVASVDPMAIALSEFNRPGLGTIQGDSLVYLANTGAGEEAGVIVMSTSLDAAFEANSPTIDELEKAIKANPQ